MSQLQKLFFKTRNKDDLRNIDKYKVGKNCFASSPEEKLGRFTNVQCNGCGIQFAVSARYICLSCHPGLTRNDGFNDYCQNVTFLKNHM